MTPLIQDALALYSLTEDPLLFDAIRILTTKHQHPEITQAAEQNVLACKQAYLTLYGNSEYPPLHGKLSGHDPD